MKANSPAEFFALIDVDGNRRIPHMIAARHGPYGYAVHPTGKGNDATAAKYFEDERAMVQAVVLHGRGVRARVVGGKQDGQSNTVALDKNCIRGYWLCPTKLDWVADARVRPISV